MIVMPHVNFDIDIILGLLKIIKQFLVYIGIGKPITPKTNILTIKRKLDDHVD